MHKVIRADNLRSAFFGAEDSLVSTTGLIAGIAVGSDSVKVVLLAGLVGVSVEALSMAAGQYLSEKAVEELDTKAVKAGNPLTTAFIMLISYAVAGLIPIIPALFLPLPWSVVAGVAAALTALFIVGYIKGKIVKRPPWRSGLEVLLIGGAATAAGVAVGLLFRT